MNTMRSAVLGDIIACKTVVSDDVEVMLGCISEMATSGSVILVESCVGMVCSMPEEAASGPVMTMRCSSVCRISGSVVAEM